MKYFYTFVTETLTRPVVVKAENQEEAEKEVEKEYNEIRRKMGIKIR